MHDVFIQPTPPARTSETWWGYCGTEFRVFCRIMSRCEGKPFSFAQPSTFSRIAEADHSKPLPQARVVDFRTALLEIYRSRSRRVELDRAFSVLHAASRESLRFSTSTDPC